MTNKIKISSNKSFGIVFFVVFLLIGIYPLINNGELRFWSIIISLIFLTLGLINSRILSPLNILWAKFGILLGKFGQFVKPKIYFPPCLICYSMKNVKVKCLSPSLL